ncbi:MAG: hypothetical protein ACRC2R_24625 [Xenococcaceae cyanobacterium]
MESSGPSGNSSEPAYQRWAGVLGTVIAVMTLTLPVLTISYYSSSNSNAESLPPKNLPMDNN